MNFIEFDNQLINLDKVQRIRIIDYKVGDINIKIFFENGNCVFESFNNEREAQTRYENLKRMLVLFRKKK